MKKALKGAKPSGEMVHKMAIKSVKGFGKKKVTKPDMMAMKKGSKKTVVSMGGNKKMKSSKKGVTGMKGNVKRKAFGSMENGGKPLSSPALQYSAAGPKGTMSAAKVNAGSRQPVRFNNIQPWTNTATGKSLKKSKAKKK